MRAVIFVMAGSSSRAWAGLHWSVAAFACAWLGCGACTALPTPAPDAGGPTVVNTDAGVHDAGVKMPVLDAGLVFRDNFVAEECPGEFYGLPDIDGGEAPGVPDVNLGLCIVLNKLDVNAQLNGAPAVGMVNLQFSSGSAESEAERLPDAFGRFDVRVMRHRYDSLKYHPSGIFPNHEGPEEFGVIDLTKAAQRDLGVRSWPIRGGVFFSGLPFKSVTFPPDVTLSAVGLPPAQTVSTASNAGAYSVSLLEGVFSVYLSSPPDALAGTQLLNYPINLSVELSAPLTLDIDLPASELEGEIRVDGQPLQNRKPGSDYSLEFFTAGASDVTVRTYHEGGLPGFHALVPKNKYAVKLRLESVPDLHLPSQIYNKQLSTEIDLNQNATFNVELGTYVWEGALSVDGVLVTPQPGYNWTLYMYSFGDASEPWSLLYFDVPMVSAGFSLRVFRGNYFTALRVDDHLADGLVEGWYQFDKYLVMDHNLTRGINIETSRVSGKVLIDGKPPPPGELAGTLTFRGSTTGQYTRKLRCAEDGSYFARVPKGFYDVYFAIDSSTYPEYASGQQLVMSALDLTGSQVADVDYRTQLVAGPLRVDREVVQDTLPGADEVGLKLERVGDRSEFTWGFSGGLRNYRMRIPPGDYAMSFVIERDGIPGVAWGYGPMGLKLLVRP